MSSDGTGADAGRGSEVTTHDGTGTDASQGGCSDEESNAAEAAATTSTRAPTMEYAGVPPVSGKHWAQWPDIEKTLYAADERPELGELVHSQEHGWTMVWYDESIADDDAAMANLEDVASQVDDADLTKVVIVPWTTATTGTPSPTTRTWHSPTGATTTTARSGDSSASSRTLDAIIAFSERHPSSESNEPDAP